MVTWTDGKPEELSRQFHCVAGRAVSSLGKDPFYWFVAAAACASVHNVIATSPLDRERRLRNILDTAKAIVQEASQYPDEDDFGGASRKARAGATPKALRKLEKLVEKLLQQQNQQPNSDTSAQAPPVTSTETDTRPSNGLCLPAALVHAIIVRLDSRSAATAAASCKQLAAAHRLKSYFKLPVAYQVSRFHTIYARSKLLLPRFWKWLLLVCFAVRSMRQRAWQLHSLLLFVTVKRRPAVEEVVANSDELCNCASLPPATRCLNISTLQ